MIEKVECGSTFLASTATPHPTPFTFAPSPPRLSALFEMPAPMKPWERAQQNQSTSSTATTLANSLASTPAQTSGASTPQQQQQQDQQPPSQRSNSVNYNASPLHQQNNAQQNSMYQANAMQRRSMPPLHPQAFDSLNQQHQPNSHFGSYQPQFNGSMMTPQPVFSNGQAYNPRPNDNNQGSTNFSLPQAINSTQTIADSNNSLNKTALRALNPAMTGNSNIAPQSQTQTQSCSSQSAPASSSNGSTASAAGQALSTASGIAAANNNQSSTQGQLQQSSDPNLMNNNDMQHQQQQSLQPGSGFDPSMANQQPGLYGNSLAQQQQQSMYGQQGAFGSSGGMYGSSMMPYGGGVGGPMMSPLSKFMPSQVMHGMNNSLQTFGRLSQLLQLNFDSLHMSFTSMLRLVDNWYMLKYEIAGMTQSVSFLSGSFLILQRCRKSLLQFLGRNTSHIDLDQAWNNTQQQAAKLNGQPGMPGSSAPGLFSWLPIVLGLAFAWRVARFIYSRIMRRYRPEIALEQEQQQGLEQAHQQAQQMTQEQMMQQQQQQQQQYGMNGLQGASGFNSSYGGGMGLGAGGMQGYQSSYSPYGSSMGMGGYGSSYGSSYGGAMQGYGSSMGGYGGSGYGSSMQGMGMYGSSMMGAGMSPYGTGNAMLGTGYGSMY